MNDKQAVTITMEVYGQPVEPPSVRQALAPWMTRSEQGLTVTGADWSDLLDGKSWQQFLDQQHAKDVMPQLELYLEQVVTGVGQQILQTLFTWATQYPEGIFQVEPRGEASCL